VIKDELDHFAEKLEKNFLSKMSDPDEVKFIPDPNPT
jgi:hypothetical protein